MEDDFLLDEEDDLQNYEVQTEENDEDDDGSGENIEEETNSAITKDYGDKIPKNELQLILAYDDITYIAKSVDKKNPTAIEDAARVIVNQNPKHTSANTIEYILKALFHKQGHSRMVNTIYTPDTSLTGGDVDPDDESIGFNNEYAKAAREQISRFIEYLANRDLSKESIISKRRKQRHIPAFIIFLFSSGMYDLILDCPTMPEEYDTQIKQAMKKLLKSKYDIVEQLAQRYEQEGRQEVANRVRKLQLSWFNKEPAEIMTSAEYADLELTYKDVLIYREFRGKFTNTSKAITQDVISDMIEVVVDKDAGIYERLKDKTRSDAISDVKQVYSDWSKDNPIDSELATKIIWKDIK